MMCYLRTKAPGRSNVTYGIVTGVKTFDWNGKRFWIWHKERGKWYLIDYDSGMTVIRATTRHGVKALMDSPLWNRLQEVYETDHYKREVIRLYEYRKADPNVR